MTIRTTILLSKGHTAKSVPYKGLHQEILKLIWSKYMEINHLHIHQWWTHCFRSDRKSLEDYSCQSWPLLTYSGKDIDAMKMQSQMIQLRYTMGYFADIINIDLSAVLSILKEQLKLRKLVPSGFLITLWKSINASEQNWPPNYLVLMRFVINSY